MHSEVTSVDVLANVPDAWPPGPAMESVERREQGTQVGTRGAVRFRQPGHIGRLSLSVSSCQARSYQVIFCRPPSRFVPSFRSCREYLSVESDRGRARSNELR